MGVRSGGIIFKRGDMKAAEEGGSKLKNFVQGNFNLVIQEAFSKTSKIHDERWKYLA